MGRIRDAPLGRIFDNPRSLFVRVVFSMCRLILFLGCVYVGALLNACCRHVSRMLASRVDACMLQACCRYACHIAHCYRYVKVGQVVCMSVIRRYVCKVRMVYGRFPKIHRVFPRPWHIEIRHRVKTTSTINLFGFETLKLKIRRLKLWKPTVGRLYAGVSCCRHVACMCFIHVCL